MSEVRRRILNRRSTGDVGQIVRARRAPAVKAPKAARGVPGGVIALPDPEDFVIGHLYRAPVVYNHQRAGDNLHVSDVIGKCVRKLALAKRMGTSLPPERIHDGLGLTFAQGDAIHDYVKARMASGHPDKMYGLWGCRCGQTITERATTLSASKATCPHCKTPLNRYHEIKVVDEEYGITGSPDVLIYLDAYGAYHIVEVKSISGDLFKELVRPQPDHILQVTFYWHLMNRAGFPLTDRTSILYSNKAFSFKSPYKEFSVSPQDQVKRLEPYIEDAKAYKASLGGGPLPVRSMCATPDTPEAKKCPMQSVCFAAG